MPELNVSVRLVLIQACLVVGFGTVRKEALGLVGLPTVLVA